LGHGLIGLIKLIKLIGLIRYSLFVVHYSFILTYNVIENQPLVYCGIANKIKISELVAVPFCPASTHPRRNFFMAELLTAENLVALLTLTALEIVLGIDNVIFIAILAGKLPAHQQDRARQLGIGLAVVSRIALLFAINWVITLDENLFTIFGTGISGHDLILLGGGLFLIGKSTHEIHEKLEALDDRTEKKVAAVSSLASVLVQVVLIDVVFSLDSVITAVGISGVLAVMVPAILIAAAVMLFFSGYIARFVEQHPTFKILALAFLILIGSILVIEGWSGEVVEDLHLKNYVYFAMAFSVLVELVNMRFRASSPKPVKLHNQPDPSAAASGTGSGSGKSGGSSSKSSSRPAQKRKTTKPKPRR
jgi:predicted tellurium resistance membrane protein TerC